MCTRCAVRTPVGYRCKECVRGQQQVYYNAKPSDLPIQAGISVALGAILGGGAIFLLGMIGFFSLWISILAGPIVGGLIADLAHRAVGRRRSRYGWLVVAGGIGLGCLVGVLLNPLIGLIFAGTAVAAAVGRLRLGK